MKYMTSAEIRQKFLSYFEDKGCKRMPSSSLVPDDPSLLLTSAGMVQFKPYFLQQKKLSDKYIGTTTVQKCVRTNDIDIIGTTGRHLSFFEMLGNFSFGSYFKDEMCKWALDFSVNIMGLPIEKLYFTVYKDDDECIEIWKKLGIEPSHIKKLGEDDNFWRAGPTGPCGPCSELYYDQGPEFGCGSPDCSPGCDCDRFLEFWNLVFTQYDGQADGSFKELPKKNIDTGMGLERMAAIMQGVSSNFETDILRHLISVGEKLFDVKYGVSNDNDMSLRIIADHSRAVTFMIADGILPGNEGREYVLRRLLRRCVMKAFLLGHTSPFLNLYVKEIIRLMGDVYPELVDNKNLILRVVLSEEERFGSTLRQGKAMIDSILEGNLVEHISKKRKDLLSGKDAFVLHDTYGFPIDLTREIVSAKGFDIDFKEFDELMKQQRQRARTANISSSDAAWDIKGNLTSEIIDKFGPTKFVGYETYSNNSKIISLLKGGEYTDCLKCGETGSIFVESSPFYGEMGGQVGDTGYIKLGDNNVAKVLNTTLPEKGLHAHNVVVEKGNLQVGDAVDLSIDTMRRNRISRNHTATHILHWALRDVLGDHVKQAGSYVAPDRLRFDFTHFEALTAEQLSKVEKIANIKVMEANNVDYYNTSLKNARKLGVTALFGEKYGDEVRVLNVGDFSSELCGGCHVKNTSEIGLIKILTESSVGANSRRIEACTSFDAYQYCTNRLNILDNAARIMRCTYKDLGKRIISRIKYIKELEKELDYAYSKSSVDYITKGVESAEDSKLGFKVVFQNLGDLEGADIKQSWDVVCNHLGDNCACVLGANSQGKAILLAAGTSKAVDNGFDGQSIIKSISKYIKGGGGGRPRLAQAGGKNIDGVDKALEAARSMLL